LLFIWEEYASYYVGFVLIFNVLAAPVFTAGSISSERERQTLDLLLTTTISSWQILWGKLLAGYRVSAVLTAFLMFPLLLSALNISMFLQNWRSILVFAAICLMASIFNSVLALFMSTVFRKTSTAMMTTYSVLMTLYCLPIAIYYLIWSFAPISDSTEGLKIAEHVESIRYLGIFSPLMAADSTPFTNVDAEPGKNVLKPGNIALVAGYFGVTSLATLVLFGITMWLMTRRWKLTGRG
jgi:ABC-type transport system involved in multi-copper enzyme maturation permease subunit